MNFQAWWHASIIIALRRQTQGDPWSSLIASFAVSVSSKFSERYHFKTIRKAIQKDTQHQLLTSPCMCIRVTLAHTRRHAHTQTHTHEYTTHTLKKKIIKLMLKSCKQRHRRGHSPAERAFQKHQRLCGSTQGMLIRYCWNTKNCLDRG